MPVLDEAKVLEGFSVTHAAILDGATPAETVTAANSFDIYGVRTASIAVDTGNYDNTGDDNVLSSWFWFNFATLTVQAGYVPLETMASLAGSTVTTTGVAPAEVHSMPLWNDKSLNQPPKPVLTRILARDQDGNARTIDFVLYRVQFGPISFDGPAYKSGLLLNYTGRAVMSSKDESGNALTERAIGRIIDRPVV